MVSRALIDQTLWYCVISAEAVLCGRLAMLARSWPAFATWAMFNLIRSIALYRLQPHRQQYALVWLVTAPIAIGLLCWAAFEIVGKVPAHFSRFGTFGRRKLRQLLSGAIALAVLFAAFEAGFVTWSFEPRVWLPFMVLLDGTVTVLLGAYLCLVAWFVLSTAVPIQPNLARHASLFALFMGLKCGVLAAANILGGHGTPAVNAVLTLGSAVLYVAWAICLTKAGEKMPTRPYVSAEQIEQNEALEEAIESGLDRAVRRLRG